MNMLKINGNRTNEQRENKSKKENNIRRIPKQDFKIKFNFIRNG